MKNARYDDVCYNNSTGWWGQVNTYGSQTSILNYLMNTRQMREPVSMRRKRRLAHIHCGYMLPILTYTYKYADKKSLTKNKFLKLKE